ncbi:uncharacterized protein ACHE_31161A [Aspergillus chevalieri]|uniref:DUF7779 domain-containing protein n=1 Tax=Aspergillus chevalieri TaxID=182096 RepID=A0A7R7VNH4_ASPCH|nr:uncharacterized protein ACHE_31161A [Aspergillus chevalieri]BCR87174.1 hypothetical protein ACHE_31161A [Aspergillus chevalieri]
MKERIKAYFSQIDRKWLLIFDNADDSDMWMKDSGAASALRDFLPYNTQGHIIFTTRNRKLAVKLASSDVVHVRELDEKAGLEFLERSLIEGSLLNDHHAMITLLEQLTFLPLAVTQAAAYMNENSIGVSDYLLLLQEQEADVVELLSEDFDDDGRYKDTQNPVAMTWLISFHQVQKLDRLAADYLSLMACVDPRNIPESFLPRPASKKKMIDALGLLSAYSFITIQPGNESITLHRLVHLATRNWMKKADQFTLYIRKTADRLSETFPRNDDTNRQLWREYLPHALFLLNESVFRQQQGHYTDYIQNVGTCLYSDGRYNEAEKLLVQVMETRKQVLGPEHPDTLTSMASLTATYWNQGQWKEAKELGIQMMETQKQVLGPEHPDSLASISNLAATYRNQARWKEAEALEVHVMETQKQVLGPEHPSTLISISNLAATYRNQGRWKKAEELEIQVMVTSERVLGPNHPSTLTSISNLAATYRNQGRWKEAEKLEIQVMVTSERVLGPNHPSTLTSISNLAATYRNQGRWKEAEELEIQVMETQKQVLGPKHPSTLTSISNLAATYRNQGRWKKAEELEIQVMETQKQVLGPKHPSTLTSMANLAATYRNQGRWKEADELEIQVMETRKQVLGPEHPNTLPSVHDLAYILKQLGIIPDALTLIKKSVEPEESTQRDSKLVTGGKWRAFTRIFRRQ